MDSTDHDHRHVARCLREQRRDRAKTVVQIAEELGVNTDMLADLETAHVNMTLPLLLNLLRAMTRAERNVFVQFLASPVPSGATCPKPSPDKPRTTVTSKPKTRRKRAKKA